MMKPQMKTEVKRGTLQSMIFVNAATCMHAARGRTFYFFVFPKLKPGRACFERRYAKKQKR
jgi:hypothetical protein